MSMSGVSIVVATYNEGPALVECVRSLAAQRGVGDFEIIIIDDRSSDGSVLALEALAIPGVKIVRIDHFDHPVLTARQVALDTGLRAASGAIVCVTDADAIVPEDWAAGMCLRLEETGAQLVGGPVEFVPEIPAANRLIAWMQTVDGAFYIGVCAVLNRLGFHSGFVFGNCVFRREAYFATGGFEAMGFGLTEDLMFSRAIRKAGGRLAFLARPVATVRACASWSILIRRAQRIGSGGVSALSVLLGLWMIFWLAAAVGAVVLPGIFLLPFLLRHLAGAGFTAWWLVRSGRARLLPLALVYEPAAIAAGIATVWSGRNQRKVSWGGVDYDR